MYICIHVAYTYSYNYGTTIIEKHLFEIEQGEVYMGKFGGRKQN